MPVFCPCFVLCARFMPFCSLSLWSFVPLLVPTHVFGAFCGVFLTVTIHSQLHAQLHAQLWSAHLADGYGVHTALVKCAEGANAQSPMCSMPCSLHRQGCISSSCYFFFLGSCWAWSHFALALHDPLTAYQHTISILDPMWLLLSMPRRVLPFDFLFYRFDSP